jgi:oligopeptide transport system substrate-binding protein
MVTDNKEKSPMQSGKKFALGFLPLFLCLMTMLLAACDGPSNPQSSTGITKASADKQIAVNPYEGLSDLSTLDPALVRDIYSHQAVSLLYTGLVQLDDKGNIIDQLAASHQQGDDGVTWTFTLKENAKFSDGTPVTSADVAFSIDRALQPATRSASASNYLGLLKDAEKLSAGKIKTIIGDSILTPDSKTVVVIASKKAAYFLYTLARPNAYVVEKSFVARYGMKFTDHLTEGGGAGPWQLSQYIHGKEIDFVPNPNYYGKHPQLTKLVRPFYKNADTAYRAYQTGQVDVATVPTAQVPAARALPSHQFRQIPRLATTYMAMNFLVKPFDNIKIRQAFALALNKNLITHNIYKDTVIATNHIIPEGMPGYNPNLIGAAGVKGTAGDPTLAKQLFQQGLQEEGLTLATLPPITFTISSGGIADVRNEAAAEQQMWQSVLGVNVKINDIDFNKLLDDMQAATNNSKGLQLWEIGWIADYPDPQNWTSIQFASGAVYNTVNYGQNNSADKDTQVATQQLLAQADVNPNTTERLQQYMKAEQQLVNDVVWLPVFQQETTLVRKPCVTGVIDNAFDLVPPDDWATIYISTATPCADTSSYK